jgi:hypothetical protein
MNRVKIIGLAISFFLLISSTVFVSISLGEVGFFKDTGQNLGSSSSFGVALGDLDGDGDLDAFVANAYQPNKVWLNDGNGAFTDSGQSLGSSESWDVVLGDLDGDGDLDAFVANGYDGANKVWLNDGTGTFTDSGQSLGNSESYGVALGDLDGDGDLDAFVANYPQANKVYESVKVCRCDLNADGKCDMLDWLIFGRDWGATDCEFNQIP